MNEPIGCIGCRKKRFERREIRLEFSLKKSSKKLKKGVDKSEYACYNNSRRLGVTATERTGTASKLHRGVAQSGSARALGAWGRRFKSSHPDQVWPRGQAVKTSPFHGGNRGSIPLGVIFLLKLMVRVYGPLAQLVRAVGS